MSGAVMGTVWAITREKHTRTSTPTITRSEGRERGDLVQPPWTGAYSFFTELLDTLLQCKRRRLSPRIICLLGEDSPNDDDDNDRGRDEKLEGECVARGRKLCERLLLRLACDRIES